MGLVSPSQSNSGDTIEASDINNPINQLAAVINGGIDATNITDNSVTSAKVAAGLASSKLANPYKFSVYRSAVWTATNLTYGLIPFDTKTFDTGSNVDVVTNKGRFTAPVSGFYWFGANVGSPVGNNSIIITSLYKNGSIALRGQQMVTGSAGSQANSPGVNGFMQLTAGDYVEVYHYGGGGTGDVGAPYTYFQGYLVSTT